MCLCILSRFQITSSYSATKLCDPLPSMSYFLFYCSYLQMRIFFFFFLVSLKHTVLLAGQRKATDMSLPLIYRYIILCQIKTQLLFLVIYDQVYGEAVKY